MFPETEVEYKKAGKFSFIAFINKRVGMWNGWQVFFHSLSKNGVECGMVGKFSFIAFLKNGVECGMVGKFSFIAFLKKTGWNVEWSASFLS